MYNESESVQNDMISYLPTDVSTAPISLFKPSCQDGTGRKAPKHNLFIVNSRNWTLYVANPTPICLSDCFSLSLSLSLCVFVFHHMVLSEVSLCLPVMNEG